MAEDSSFHHSEAEMQKSACWEQQLQSLIVPRRLGDVEPELMQ